ncbi:MAG: hypothetical protein JWQ19_3039 [Subtercola sp.]|nr:hypothetical protein [Subtercola sp.]
MEHNEVRTRVQLRALVDEYAWLADQRDLHGWADLFTDDGSFTAFSPGAETPFASSTGRAELVEVLHGNDAFPHTFHFIANHHVTVTGEQTAHGITYAQAHHTLGEGERTQSLVWLIRYHDEYVYTPAGWKFAARELQLAWIEHVDSDVSAFPFRRAERAE